MKKISTALKIAGIILLALVSFIVVCVAYNTDDGVIEVPAVLIKGDIDINSLNIEFKDNNIVLNVHTSTPLTCREVIRALSISPITLKNKVYRPGCIKVSNTLMQVIYKETLSV